MSRLRFDLAPEAPPVDVDGALEPFQVVGAFPVATPGERYPTHAFTGVNGWQVDSTSALNGFNAITVRAVCAPDWANLDGAGFAALASYGDGGPTASEYHSYSVGLVVVGSTVTIRGEYQDALGVAKAIDIGSFSVPPGTWHQIAVTRERNGEDQDWAAYLDGVPVGTGTTTDALAFGQATVWSLANRSTLGTAGAFFRGEIEQLVVEARAATVVEERQSYRARLTREQYRAIVADAMPRARTSTENGMAVEQGSLYHAYRVRPLADGLGLAKARADNWDAAALPPDCYNSQLALWERSLGIQPDDSRPAAQRQADVTARFTDPGGFTVDRMRTIGAQIMGVSVGDVAALEPSTRVTPQTTAVSATGAQGPWIVCGNGTADFTASGLALASRLDTDLRWFFDDRRAQEATIALDHADQSFFVNERRVAGGGFAATLVSLSGSSATQWAGLILAGLEVARHIGVYFDGFVFQVAYRDTTRRTLGAWTAVGELAIGGQLGVFFDLKTSSWTISRNDTPSDPYGAVLTPMSVPGGLSTVLRIGLSQAAEGALTGDLASTWTDAIVEWPRVETSRKYYLHADTPAQTDPVGQTNTLRAAERPTTRGHITYQQQAIAGDPGAFVDFTPLALTPTTIPLPLGDDRAGAWRNLGFSALSLWTFQEPGAPLADRIAATRLYEPAGVSITYQAAGPDADRVAVTLTSSSPSYLTTRDPQFQDTGSTASAGAIVVYRYDPGLDGVFLEKTSGGISIVLRQTGTQVELALDDGGGELTLDVMGTDSAWVVAGFFTDDAGNCALATAAESQSAGFGLTSLSNSGIWTVGSPSGSADATFRWIAWHPITNPIELQAACALVAQSL